MFLKVHTDIGCRVYVDDELKAIAENGSLFKLQLEKGQYWVRFESLYDTGVFIEKEISITDYDILEKALFLPLTPAEKMILVPFRSDDGLYGYRELFSGHIIVYPCYTEARNISEGFAEVFRGNLQGIINKKGEEIIPCEYEEIVGRPPYRFACLKKNGLWAPFNRSLICKNDSCDELTKMRKNTFDFKYEEVTWREGAFIMKKDGFWGIMDENNNWFTPFEYDSWHQPDEKGSLICLHHKDGYNVLFDISQRWPIVEEEFNYWVGYERKDGLRFVSTDEGRGLVNKDWKVITPCKYSDIGPFVDGLAMVAIELGTCSHRYGYINTSGEEVIPCRFDSASDFSEGIAYVGGYDHDKKIYGAFINTKGDLLFEVPRTWDYNKHPFVDGLVVFIPERDRSHFGYIDKTGKRITPLDKYQYLNRYEKNYNNVYLNGLRLISKDNLFGFMDKSGHEVVPPQYSDVRTCTERSDRLFVKKDDKWGILGPDGSLIVSCSYQWITDLKEPLIKKDTNGKKALYDLNEKPLTPFKYDGIWDFINNKAFVLCNQCVGIVNSSGNEILSPTVYKVRECHDIWGPAVVGRLFAHVYKDNVPGELLLDSGKFLPLESDRSFLRQVWPELKIGRISGDFIIDGHFTSREWFIELVHGKQILPSTRENLAEYVPRKMNGKVCFCYAYDGPIE